MLSQKFYGRKKKSYQISRYDYRGFCQSFQRLWSFDATSLARLTVAGLHGGFFGSLMLRSSTRKTADDISGARHRVAPKGSSFYKKISILSRAASGAFRERVSCRSSLAFPPIYHPSPRLRASEASSSLLLLHCFGPFGCRSVKKSQIRDFEALHTS